MSAAAKLEILWIRHDEMTPEQVHEYDLLEQAAFAAPGAEHEESGPPQEWDRMELHCLGLLSGRMVTHAGLVERQITVAGQAFTAAGVGAVCTHPAYQRRGYARAIMEEVRRAIYANPRVHLGLLFCAPELIPYYASCGWQHGAEPLYALQFGKRVMFDSDYMLLLKPGAAILRGEVDLQNLPW